MLTFLFTITACQFELDDILKLDSKDYEGFD